MGLKLGLGDLDQVRHFFVPMDGEGISRIWQYLLEKIHRIVHFIRTGVWVNYHRVGRALNAYRFSQNPDIEKIEQRLNCILGRHFTQYAYDAAMVESSYDQIANRWKFLRRFIQSPMTVGAISPSSQKLAEGILGHMPNKGQAGCSRRYLEVGPGTGIFTYQLITTKLREQDILDVVEFDGKFVVILRQRFGHLKNVRIIHTDFTKYVAKKPYDYCVSGLPLGAFPVELVEKVYDVFNSVIKSKGELSYFEYLGLCELKIGLATRKVSGQLSRVLEVKESHYREHSGTDEKIWFNFTPARVCYLRF